MSKIKYLSLFSGIGAPEKAMKRLGIEYELLGFSEIDKYAIKSYCKVHDVSEDKNLGDITKIDIESLPTDIDLITQGSPCQDFSISGLQKGGDMGSGTRSSLMWYTVDIVEHCKPKYVIWENVKNLLSKKHRHNFDGYLKVMEELGYKNYYKVLNAKDYGIPQNRERVFTISIRNDIEKDFVFPSPIELKLRLKDLLEDNVDEKYYINTERANTLIQKLKESGQLNSNITPCDSTIMKPKRLEIANCITARYNAGIQNKQSIGVAVVERISPTLDTMNGGQREPKILVPKRIEEIKEELPCIVASRGKNPENPSDRTPEIHTEQRLEINKKGLSNTLTTVQKDNLVLEKAYKVRVANKTGYQIAKKGDSINLEQPNSTTRRGRVGNQKANTLNTGCNQAVVDNYGIRKLTPLECWRLMGFDEDDFYKAAEVCSNSQLYKQAGNSIVVNVLERIFENLF